MKAFLWACVNFLALLSVQVLDVDSNREGSDGTKSSGCNCQERRAIFYRLPFERVFKAGRTPRYQLCITYCRDTERNLLQSNSVEKFWFLLGLFEWNISQALQVFSKWPQKSVSDDAFCDTFVKNELGLKSINCIIGFATCYRHMLICNCNEN